MIYMSVSLSCPKMRRWNYVCACSKSVLGGKNLSITPVLFISTILYSSSSMDGKNDHLEMRKFKLTELQRLKNRGKKAEDKMRT